jgi:hypothetical protein
VLDDVEEVAVGVLAHAGAVGEVAGTDQEEHGPPGAATVGAVALCAEAVVEARGPRRPGRRLRDVEQPGEPAGEGTDHAQRDHERDDRPASAHRGEISTADRGIWTAGRPRGASEAGVTEAGRR